jgi:membrane protein implicated in regulation of membrane protease activity
MPAWALWVIVAVALAGVELLTPGLFVAGLLVVPALAAALVATLGGSAAIQLIVFILGSGGSALLVRPLARRHIRMPAQLRTGTAALVGAPAMVLRRVDRDGGLVRIGGEEWSARTYMDDQVIEPGARVEVVKIEGATAIVME